jgi:hypothetical protein
MLAETAATRSARPLNCGAHAIAKRTSAPALLRVRRPVGVGDFPMDRTRGTGRPNRRRISDEADGPQVPSTGRGP